MHIVIYSKPDCVQCHWTRRLLDTMGLEYQEVDVTLDPTARRDVEKMVIDGKPVGQLPVVVVSNAARTLTWSGFKVEKIRGLKSSTGDY